jgi:predicted DNA-binding transcriptional regulator AlpA
MDNNEPRLLTRKEVAELLRKSVRWLYYNYGNLVKKRAFPRPRLGVRHGARWARADLLKWIDGEFEHRAGSRDTKPAGPARSGLERQRQARQEKRGKPARP